MTWIFEQALPTYNKISHKWDALNRQNGDHILLDSRFIMALLRHFGSERVLLGINDSGQESGMVFLVKHHPGVWETFQPSQSPLGLILLGEPDSTGANSMKLLYDLPGYAFQLGIMHQDPEYSPFFPTAESGNIEILDYIRTATLPVQGSFEDYWNSRSKNLRHNLERQRRRLKERRQSLELIIERDPSRMLDCLREYGQLESSGWKGRDGTAVSLDNAQGQFYREVLSEFCASGEGIVFKLSVDGRVVASDLCLMRKGMLVVLKTAYDESLDAMSPALLMRQEIIQYLYATGEMKVIEFYGRVLQWHTKWTDKSRAMYHINLFRTPWMDRTRKLLRRFA